MLNSQIERRRDLPGPARLGAVICLIAGLAAFQACATGSEVETSASPGATGPGGGGGAGGDGGAGGSAGGGTACEPGATEDCYTGPAGTEDVGACKGGTRTCDAKGAGWGACEGEVLPAGETCETLDDDDCDGVANEEGTACVCVPGDTMPCYTGPMGTEGVGQCAPGTATCNELGVGYDACDGEVVPAAEDCSNQLDDDCDAVACAATLWSVMFGGSLADKATSTAIDSAGNVYVGGMFSGTMMVGPDQLVSAGGTDGFLVKFDATGAYQWAQAFGDAADQAVLAVGVDAADEVFIGGYFSGTLTLGGMSGATYMGNGRDAFLAKLTGTGSYLWSKRMGVAGSQQVTSLAVNAAGEVVVGGTFDGTLVCPFGCITSLGGQDIFLYKFNAQGQQQYIKLYGDPAEQLLNAVAFDPAGNLLLAGQLQGSTTDFGGGALGSAGGFDAFVVKLDPMGTHLWSRRYGDPIDQRAASVVADPAGNVIVAGNFASSINFGALDIQSAGFNDLFVLKLDPDGAYLWANTYGDATDQLAGGIGTDAAGNIALTGAFEGKIDFGGGPLSSTVTYDVFVAKLTDMGAHIWSKGYGNSASQVGGALHVSATTGEIFVTSTAAGTIDFGNGPLTSAGVEDVTLAKISP